MWYYKLRVRVSYGGAGDQPPSPRSLRKGVEMSVPKATAAMTSNSSQTPSNMDAQREGFFDQCSQFGTNAGAGDTSKVGWFQATVEAAWQGIIVPAAGRRKKGDISSPLTDAEIAYKRFADARKAKAGE